MTAFGQPGTREIFDTGAEIIGIYIDRFGNRSETTRGLIHYGTGGAHIVPATPRPAAGLSWDHPNSPDSMREVILWCLDENDLRRELTAVSFSFSFSPFTRSRKGVVTLRLHVAATPSAETVDLAQVLETLLLSHETDYFTFGHEIIVAPAPAERADRTHLAWVRQP